MPFERVMRPSLHIMENNGDLQPIARPMNPTLWVPSENFLLVSSLKTDFSQVITAHWLLNVRQNTQRKDLVTEIVWIQANIGSEGSNRNYLETSK